jgi:hypothetical protein
MPSAVISMKTLLFDFSKASYLQAIFKKITHVYERLLLMYLVYS